MLSGPIPPNPAELLENEMFESMLKTLRETYDFIVIDTSPLGLVPDYFIIEDLVDVTLFVIRQGYTKKPLLADLDRISKSGKLKRTYLLLNDYDHKSSYGGKYGYGYGYGYGSVGYGYLDDDNLEKTWIQKIREKIGV
jgi:Mrp family chromosome partitioning ATPase